MAGLGETWESQPLSSKALTGVVLALSALLCVRMVYRTVRSTVALLFWLIRWGFVLYVVLWAWLWCTTADEPGSVQHGLATLQNTIHGLIALGWNLLQYGQQQPGLSASVLQAGRQGQASQVQVKSAAEKRP
ncbi:hypothetical protein MCAP1_000655 [Malassezia caprae]|uniref:Uncharacterized protein n=1 Tax=Malassezia caprae TaxID=1381934 RepID=A0AAF0E9A3_9BASI|nr:hypothetical protein MCAP1_000655 [Malassezia caprae]